VSKSPAKMVARTARSGRRLRDLMFADRQSLSSYHGTQASHRRPDLDLLDTLDQDGDKGPQRRDADESVKERREHIER
jgi:hypothetical protein